MRWFAHSILWLGHSTVQTVKVHCEPCTSIQCTQWSVPIKCLSVQINSQKIYRASLQQPPNPFYLNIGVPFYLNHSTPYNSYQKTHTYGYQKKKR